jgi:hypothetical protein
MEIVKASSAYAATAVLGWAASRYHLSGDQVAAILADLGTLAAAGGGVWMHVQNRKKEDKNGN